MTTAKPRISVIMSVYNGERYLREAIDSILNQTFKDFEFIIVDDGSTDNSLSIIQSYRDKRLKLIKNEKNIGLTKSLNNALKTAGGEFIARQDADDISLPDRLEEQIRFLVQHPDVALLGTGVFAINEEGKLLRRETPLSNPVKKLWQHNQFVHGSVTLKKKVIDELGPYHELFRYSQDYELWLRIAKSYQVANLTQPLYKKRSYNESVQATKRKEGALYHLLALRLVDGNLDENLLRIIKEEGILSFYMYLNKSEKIYLHKSVARAHIGRGDLQSVREEYRKVLALAPFDIKNMVAFLLSYLGKGITDEITKIHCSFKSFLNLRIRSSTK